MSIKRPLCIYDGKVKEVQTGDTLYGASSGDIALSKLAPSTDETITTGNSAVIVRSYTIASGKKLVIESGSRLRIL